MGEAVGLGLRLVADEQVLRDELACTGASFQGWVLPNAIRPPFDTPTGRQALLHLVDQELHLRAAIGNPDYYRTCASFYPCGTPYETSAGAVPREPERARALLKQAGYGGEPIVVVDPADIPNFHAAALMTAERLRGAGVNVDVRSMEWGTAVSVRPKREAWHVFHTAFAAVDLTLPASHPGFAATGDVLGWHRSETMARLRAEWHRAQDEAARKRLAADLQRLGYEEVPYVSYGEYRRPWAFRKVVKGIVRSPVVALWNIWLEA